LGRIINPESAGKDRARLTRSVLLAVRELMKQTEINPMTRDLAAYLAEALEEIYQTIDASVSAWEKRGYWVKADRFRMEWLWSEQLAQRLRQNLQTEDWGGVAQIAAQTAARLAAVKVPQRHKLGEPWNGAWERFLHRQPQH
jgi:hypothetical protein